MNKNIDSKDTDKKIALIIFTLSSFITPFMSSSINIALPSIGKEFSMNTILLSWVATAFILSAAMFLVPFGRIADIYGRKKVFLYGIFIYSFASLLCAISSSSGLLIVFRVLQGIGSAMTFGSGMAILTSVFPPGERGRALGINVAAVYTGLALGPFFGGLLTYHFGWRSIFLVNVFLGSMILLFILWKLKGEWVEAKNEKFDLIGSVIYSSSLIAIIYGFSLFPSTPGLLLFVAGIIGLLMFIFWENKIGNPILNIRLFRNNIVFTFSNLSALINYSATSAVGFLLSLYLQYVKGFNPKHAGLILVSQPVVMAILSPFAGKLSDKIEPRIVASSGMALTVIGLSMLLFLNISTSLGFIILSLIILGFGFALFSSPNTNAVMSSVDKKFYGVASATLGTMRLTGQMFSMGIAMLIFSIYIGKVQITPEYYLLFTSSVKTAFLIFAILCFFGIFASLARGKVR